MENYQVNNVAEEARELSKDTARVAADMACMADQVKRITEMVRLVVADRDDYIRRLEARVERLENDPWSSRVTYENVVELIASNEDARERDRMRHVFEPMLKREQVRQLRRDVKRRVKELEEAEGYASAPRTFVNNGTYNEVQPGGSNVANHFARPDDMAGGGRTASDAGEGGVMLW